MLAMRAHLVARRACAISWRYRWYLIFLGGINAAGDLLLEMRTTRKTSEAAMLTSTSFLRCNELSSLQNN